MDNDPKTDTKTRTTYTLDPVVDAWVMQTAAQQTIQTGKYISASSIANLVLKAAMEIESGGEDTEHLRKLIKKHIQRIK